MYGLKPVPFTGRSISATCKPTLIGWLYAGDKSPAYHRVLRRFQKWCRGMIIPSGAKQAAEKGMI
jgi:hypothetical protein